MNAYIRQTPKPRSLGARTQAVVALYLDGVPFPEIARRLKMPQSSAKGMFHNARGRCSLRGWDAATERRILELALRLPARDAHVDENSQEELARIERIWERHADPEYYTRRQVSRGSVLGPPTR